MNYYLSYYPKGFHPIVDQVLKSYLNDANVLFKNQTIIVFKTSKHWSYIKELEIFETSFFLIKLFENLQEKSLAWQFSWALNNKIFYQRTVNFFRGEKSLRIVDSRPKHDRKEFQDKRGQIEQKLKKKYRIKIDRGHPDFEIRFIEKNNIGFIGIRISSPPQYKKGDQKDSLRKEVAAYMIYLSEPQNKDVVIDPFCGSGIIPMMRSKVDSYKQIIASDNSIAKITKKLKGKEPLSNFKIMQFNFRALDRKIVSKVNKIITDPPWGLIEKIPDVKGFYEEIFNKFKKVIIKNGLIILLSNQEKVIDSILHKDTKLLLINKFEIEVSGLKSFVYKIRSRN